MMDKMTKMSWNIMQSSLHAKQTGVIYPIYKRSMLKPIWILYLSASIHPYVIIVVQKRNNQDTCKVKIKQCLPHCVDVIWLNFRVCVMAATPGLYVLTM